MLDYIAQFNAAATQTSLVDILEFLGTIAFAISGIRLSSAKQFDWFGAIVVGFVTAVGGGTLRDLLLGVPVFWLQTAFYFSGTFFAFIIVLLFRKHLVKAHIHNTIFWFDCIGLGLFTVVGFEKALNLGHSYWVCLTMGTITGVVGGIVRDILINEVPIIFKQELYASACIVGGLLLILLHFFGIDAVVSQVTVFLVVIVFRYLSIRHHWTLPTLKS